MAANRMGSVPGDEDSVRCPSCNARLGLASDFRAEALVAQLRKQGFSAYLKSTERLHIVRLRPAGSEPLEDTLERVNRLGHAGQIFGE